MAETALPKTLTGSPLLQVLEKSLKVTKSEPKAALQPPPPEKPQVQPEKVEKLAQFVEWALVDVPYGTALSELPRAEVIEGNPSDVPQYTPRLSIAIPDAGSHPVSVFVPGNDVYLDTTLPKTLTVKRGKLLVKVEPVSMFAGGKLPELKYSFEGLMGSDAAKLEFGDCPDANSPPNPTGYDVRQTLTFTSGDAKNYDVTLPALRIPVLGETFEELDEKIGVTRREILKFGYADILARLDEVKTKRDNAAIDPAALARVIGEVQADLDKRKYDDTTAKYVAVTAVAVKAVGAARMETDGPVQLQAVLTPPDPTVPGVEWTPDESGLVDVSSAGEVRRKPGSVDGGTVVIRATSKSREKLFAPIAIEIAAKPTAVTIAPPGHVFYDKPVQLKATVEPPDAVQRVTWKVSGKPKNVTFTNGGLVTVRAPDRSGGVKSGSLDVIAISEIDQKIVGNLEVQYGGAETTEIQIELPRGAKIEQGATLMFSARAIPDGASQRVKWELNGGGIAETVSETDNTISLKFKQLGQVELSAKSVDGTNITRSRWLGTKYQLVGLSIVCPQTMLDINDTPQATAVFDPPQAREQVVWSTGNPKILKIDAKGNLQPIGAGTTTVTLASQNSTIVAKPIPVTVQIGTAQALTDGQFDTVRVYIDKYAKAIGIVDNEPANKHYGKYMFKLRQDVMKGCDTRNGGPDTAIGGMVNLAQVKTELVALRDKFYSLTHREWLLEAGFSESRNCMLRDESNIVVGGFPMNAHITMFDTGELLPIGATAQGLINKVYRVNAQDYAGLHATAYVYPGNHDDQIKAYISGWDWKPSPGTNIQKWENDKNLRPTGVSLVQWQNDATQHFWFFTVRAALLVWLHANRALADQALTNYFNQARAHDADAIG
jgi:hypothetical protein